MATTYLNPIFMCSSFVLASSVTSAAMASDHYGQPPQGYQPQCLMQAQAAAAQIGLGEVYLYDVNTELGLESYTDGNSNVITADYQHDCQIMGPNNESGWL